MIKRYSHPYQKRALMVHRHTRGTEARPRLTVFRSLKQIYAQIINDQAGKTLAAAFGTDAAAVGKDLAVLALTKKISTVVFDRGRYQYHGRVKALAEAARQGGLKF